MNGFIGMKLHQLRKNTFKIEKTKLFYGKVKLEKVVLKSIPVLTACHCLKKSFENVQLMQTSSSFLILVMEYN